MFFFPLIFCEESTSGCVILSPHYNALFITLFQPSVYSLISWLLGLQVYNFSMCWLFCDQDSEQWYNLDSHCSMRYSSLQDAFTDWQRILRSVCMCIAGRAFTEFQMLPCQQDLARDLWLLLVVV